MSIKQEVKEIMGMADDLKKLVETPSGHWDRFGYMITPQAERDYMAGNDTVEER